MNATNVVCSILMFSQIVSGAHFSSKSHEYHYVVGNLGHHSILHLEKWTFQIGSNIFLDLAKTDILFR